MKKLMLITALGLIRPIANAEMPAAAGTEATAASFEQVDTDENGLITKQEAQSFAAVELIFDAADTNKDGALDAGEFSHAQPAGEAE